MMKRSIGIVVAASALVVAVANHAGAYPRPGRTVLVSRGLDGGSSDPSYGARISDDGRWIVFVSAADDLVSGDTNRNRDIFVAEVATGAIERVSVSLAGGDPNGASDLPAISGDGRFVVFQSFATNLADGDTNQHRDVFLFDRAARVTERISIGPAGQGNRESIAADVSDDGRVVAFTSRATNLDPADANTDGTVDLFVRDRVLGTTRLASVATTGQSPGGIGVDSTAPALSADGRFLAFASLAGTIVANDQNRASDIFVRDLAVGATERVSVTSGGGEANGVSVAPSISADGRSVAFASFASNLVPRDGNGSRDVYVHDRSMDRTERVSITSTGGEQHGGLGIGDGLPLLTEDWTPGTAISADGRYVAFVSSSADLAPGGIAAQPDVLIHDRLGRTTERVSVPDADAADGDGVGPSVSADGRFVAFDSAGSLVNGDGPARDVFVRDRGPEVGIGELVAAPDGGVAHVEGWISLSPVAVAAASDPPADALAGARELGGEIVSASVVVRPEPEDLLLRLDLGALPSARPWAPGGPVAPHQFSYVGPSEGGSPLVHGVRFTADGVRHEVRILRVRRDGSTEPSISLWRCAPACSHLADLAGSYARGGDELFASLPLTIGTSFSLEADDALTSIAAFSAIADPSGAPVQMVDEAALQDAAIPRARIALGVADAGTPEGSVTFEHPVLGTNGRFSTTLAVPSGKVVWGRGCLGTRCGLAVASA